LKTPLTITAKFWNYCQNGAGCPYCVAGCGKDRWRYRDDFEALPPDEVLDVDCLIAWIKRYTPNCVVHVSGGEPLLRPDVENQVEKLVNHGIPTTITTNGMMISQRPRLLTMPLKWIVTHHECNNFAEWRYNADLIRNQPHIACRLLFGADSVRRALQLTPYYQGLNFMWAKLHSTRITDWQPNPDDLDVIASDVIHLVEPNGVVYPCNNNSKRPIGNIYTGEYCRDAARTQNAQCRECIRGNLCGAYQTAVLVYRLRHPSPLA
jgi:MoaA/NifB/PqqE/SkfB family radical SAM enzyme